VKLVLRFIAIALSLAIVFPASAFPRLALPASRSPRNGKSIPTLFAAEALALHMNVARLGRGSARFSLLTAAKLAFVAGTVGIPLLAQKSAPTVAPPTKQRAASKSAKQKYRKPTKTETAKMDLAISQLETKLSDLEKIEARINALGQIFLKNPAVDYLSTRTPSRADLVLDIYRNLLVLLSQQQLN
jgi:hypothetical protein